MSASVVVFMIMYIVTSVLGGLKSLQSSEALLGFASSLESMTMTVRDAMIDSWGISGELDEEAEMDEDLTAAAEDERRPMDSDTDHTETEHNDHSVQSDCDEGYYYYFLLIKKQRF